MVLTNASIRNPESPMSHFDQAAHTDPDLQLGQHQNVTGKSNIMLRASGQVFTTNRRLSHTITGNVNFESCHGRYLL